VGDAEDEDDGNDTFCFLPPPPPPHPPPPRGSGATAPSICAFCLRTSAGVTMAQLTSCAMELLSTCTAGCGRKALGEEAEEEEPSAAFNPSYVVKKTPDEGTATKATVPTPW
jgi:hypothetical protein